MNMFEWPPESYRMIKKEAQLFNRLTLIRRRVQAFRPLPFSNHSHSAASAFNGLNTLIGAEFERFFDYMESMQSQPT